MMRVPNKNTWSDVDFTIERKAQSHLHSLGKILTEITGKEHQSFFGGVSYGKALRAANNAIEPDYFFYDPDSGFSIDLRRFVKTTQLKISVYRHNT